MPRTAQVLRDIATDMDLDEECDHLPWVKFSGLCFCANLRSLADDLDAPPHPTTVGTDAADSTTTEDA